MQPHPSQYRDNAEIDWTRLFSLCGVFAFVACFWSASGWAIYNFIL